MAILIAVLAIIAGLLLVAVIDLISAGILFLFWTHVLPAIIPAAPVLTFWQIYLIVLVLSFVIKAIF